MPAPGKSVACPNLGASCGRCVRSVCLPPTSVPVPVPCFFSASAPCPLVNLVHSHRATRICLHPNCFYNSVLSLSCSHEGVCAISAIPTTLGQTTQ